MGDSVARLGRKPLPIFTKPFGLKQPEGQLCYGAFAYERFTCVSSERALLDGKRQIYPKALALTLNSACVTGLALWPRTTA